mmetsp:Transcript_5359/g.21231  ORF Transcript_5359/g.21231 Transcript_5359/m.21231 type:complete len:209 (+) Transcript_5359:9241-9867(+)
MVVTAVSPRSMTRTSRFRSLMSTGMRSLEPSILAENCTRDLASIACSRALIWLFRKALMLCPTPELTRDTREEPANCKSAWIQGALYTSSNGKMRKSTATSLRPRAAFGLELTLNSRLLGTMKPPIFTRGFSAPGLGSTIEGKHVSFAARSTTWKPPSTSVLSQESSTARSVCSPSKMICTSSSDPTRKLTNPSFRTDKTLTVLLWEG